MRNVKLIAKRDTEFQDAYGEDVSIKKGDTYRARGLGEKANGYYIMYSLEHGDTYSVFLQDWIIDNFDVRKD